MKSHHRRFFGAHSARSFAVTRALRAVTASLLAATTLLTSTMTGSVAPAGASALDKIKDNPVIVGKPVQHPGAPTPQAFSPDRILRFYQSDNSVTGLFYFHTIRTFDDLRKKNPEVMQQNLSKVIDINHAAQGDQKRVDRALADAHDDLMLTMSDAWGPTVGGYFRAAVAENRLPKTQQILSGTLARGGMVVSSTFAEKYAYGYDRPFVVAPDKIVRYYRPGGEADDEGYSTTPSFPSGHTNQATWKSTIMAAMLPELGTQMIARGSEVGYNRIVMGVHYPLDVIGGRQSGQAAAADRLRDPEFRTLVDEAARELRAELEWRCGTSLVECIAKDARYLSNANAVDIFTQRMTYGFPRVSAPGQPLLVPGFAEELLRPRFPQLTTDQLRSVLFQTAIDSGYPLDSQGKEGSWNRINLAKAWASNPVVNPDGSISLR